MTYYLTVNIEYGYIVFHSGFVVCTTKKYEVKQTIRNIVIKNCLYLFKSNNLGIATIMNIIK